jgi:hypothetical protein
MQFKNEKWLVDYEADTGKGTVDDLKNNKRYYFTDNFGLPEKVPAYIRKIVMQMIGKYPPS